MIELVAAEGPLLDEILASSFEIWSEGLSRSAYTKYNAAQRTTPWGRAHLRHWALVDGGQLLASAKEYLFDATLDGRAIRACGIGAVFTQPRHRGRGHARALIERLIERAAVDGCDLALLFSEIDPAYYARLGFTPIPTCDLDLRIVESSRHGAPAMLVRSGDDRDLTDLAAMGDVRASPYRFHLNRDRDLIHYAIAKKRVMAGLDASGARAVQFFVAEEGAAAVAYAVIRVRGSEWTLDEAGDRDPSGARVGAILQVLLARDPAEQRPSIKAWLPAGFRPPQIEIVAERPSKEVMMIRPLTARGTLVMPLPTAAVFYWFGDLF
jgi:GNAT superfamily N-acetyltransferase